MQTSYDQFLESFFNNEIYFLSSASLQREAWTFARGEEKFGTCLLLSFEAWSVIVEHRKQFKLSEYQFNKIHKLFNMIEEFQALHDYPKKPSEYQELLANPEWKNIQRYAQEIYHGCLAWH